MDNIKDLERYAKEVLDAKGQSAKEFTLLQGTERAIRLAFNTTYHAVALDVDGTITESWGQIIPDDISRLLSKILDEGVYLIFVTGGSSGTISKIVDQLFAYNKQKKGWRIYAITGEGCRLIKVAENGNLVEEQISQSLKSLLNDYYPTFLKDLQYEFGEDFDIVEKECAVRMVSKAGSAENELIAKVSTWYSTRPEEIKAANIKPAMGRFDGKLTYNMAVSNKDTGLLKFYTEYDFLDVPILRIGDQGSEGGNDWSLLDSVYGFSVGALNTDPFKSFPVFHEEEGYRRLYGVEGTKYLLGRMKWSRRLSLPSFLAKESNLSYLETIKKIKTAADEKIGKSLIKWSKEAIELFGEESVKEAIATRFGSILDNRSGAVWLSDYEWNHAISHNLFEFFSENHMGKHNDDGPPNMSRILFLDSGIILRGSKYYWGLLTSVDEKLVANIAEDTLELQKIVLNMSFELNKSDPFLDWKLKLGVLDHLRNNCLILYSMLFQAASVTTNSKFAWKRLLIGFKNYASSAISIYYSLLLLNFKQINDSVIDLRNSASFFYELRQEVELLFHFLIKNKIKEDKIVRKWRETDHPGEIIVCLESILKDANVVHKQTGKLSILGLMYGGVELPFVFRYLYKREFNENISIGHLGGISFYRREAGGTIMEHFTDTVLESAIADSETVEDVLPKGGPVIILDDNIMTGRTIELAKDRLISYGCEVPFSACVRYPPGHRVKQMEMKNHGGIDPLNLGTKIKGLVRVSPYSRIFSSADYKDVTGSFDRSRDRIERYLLKNRTDFEKKVN